MSMVGAGTPEERARKHMEDRAALLVHVALFVVGNIAVWVIDAVTGGGIQWAYWTTIGWSIAIVVHAGVYFLLYGKGNDQRYQRYLAEERAKDSGSAQDE